MRPLSYLAIATLFAGACRSASEPAAVPTVRASVAQSTVTAGQAVLVDVTVTNETSVPMEIFGGPMAFLEVRDAADRVVAFGRFEVFDMALRPPLRLGPGETRTDRAPWAGELTGETRRRAPPGTYQLRAAVAVVSASARVYSAPVTVVLTPP
jgi:hypothetical protein